MANSVDPDETPLGVHCLLRSVRSNTYSKVQHMIRVMLRQTGKIMTKSSVITNRLSIAMAELIINYFSALISQPYHVMM